MPRLWRYSTLGRHKYQEMVAETITSSLAEIEEAKYTIAVSHERGSCLDAGPAEMSDQKSLELQAT
jgi:hypothetical protein